MPRSPDEALADFCPGLPFAVALSGGADSTALLIACAQRWPGQVRAVHVHHGLQSAADDFERFCRQLCEGLQVPLSVQRVDAHPVPGQSPEDAARQARYRALADAVRQVSDLKPKDLLERRYERLQSYGRFTDTKAGK